MYNMHNMYTKMFKYAAIMIKSWLSFDIFE